MSKTIIGVFNTMEQAEAAKKYLMEKGCQASSIQVHSYNDNRTSTPETSMQNHDEGFLEGIKRFFSELFGDDDDSHASHYTEAVRRGHALLSVEVEEHRVDEVCTALNRAGAIDIDSKLMEWKSDGYSGFSSSQVSKDTGMIDQKESIPVVQEELEVGKRTINKGAVRVHSRTIETPVKESINLKEQHARVERHPTDRPATAADMEAFQGGSIEIPETEEKVVANKTARVIEEVEVGSEESEHVETVEDTVRHNEVEVERNNLRNSPRSDNKPSLRH